MAAALVLVAGCEKKEPPPPPPPPLVQVLEVTPTKITHRLEFIGQLDSPQNVEVRARVEAFVEAVLFTEGTEVKAGDPLFRLDKKPFEERLAAAQGGLAEAKAALNKYEKDVARLQPLAEKKAIPQQDLDNAIASVDVGKANVQSAEARLQSAMLDLGYCDVVAPITGIIGAKEVAVGSLVGKGEPTLLATISQMDPIWCYCAVSEVEYLRAERRVRETGGELGKLPVALVLSDGSTHPEVGRWVFRDRAVDITTGTIRVRAEFPNGTQVLRPGMFARLRVEAKSDEPGLLVPERAVVELQGKSFLWVVGPDSTVTQRPVQVALQRQGDKVQIVDGLKAGERIVVEGQQKIRQGAKVQPATAEQMEAAKEAAKAAAAKPADAKPGDAKPAAAPGDEKVIPSKDTTKPPAGGTAPGKDKE